MNFHCVLCKITAGKTIIILSIRLLCDKARTESDLALQELKKPLHDINRVHQGTGPRLKFNGVVYQS